VLVESRAHAVEARPRPLLAHVLGKAERGVPVHDRPAAHRAAGEDADREVLGGEELAIPEQAGGAAVLAPLELVLGRERALLEHEDVSPRRRELGGGDAATGSRPDDDRVSGDDLAGADGSCAQHGLGGRVERGRRVAGARPERVGGAVGPRIRDEERESLRRLEGRAARRQRALPPRDQVALALVPRHRAERPRPPGEHEVRGPPLDDAQEEHEIGDELWPIDRFELGDDRVGDRP